MSKIYNSVNLPSGDTTSFTVENAGFYIDENQDIESLKQSIDLNRVSSCFRIYVLFPDETINYEIPREDIKTGGSYSENYQSGQRRSLSFTLYNHDGNYNPTINTLWAGTRLKLDVGIKVVDEVVWFSKGIFIINKVTPSYTTSGKEVVISAGDKFSIFENSTGKLETSYEISTNENIEQIVASIQKMELGNGEVFDPKPALFYSQFKTKLTQATISKSAGDTYGSILTELATQLSAEVFYNSEGNLVFIPTTEVTEDKYKSVIYGYKTSEGQMSALSFDYDYNTIVNRVIVIGTSSSGGIFQAVALNNDEASPLCCQRVGYRTGEIINDSNITTDYLARERAEYELRQQLILKTTTSASVPFNPFLSVNNLIEITDDFFELKRAQYLIQSVSFNLDYSGSMSISFSNIDNLSTAIEVYSGVIPKKVAARQIIRSDQIFVSVDGAWFTESLMDMVDVSLSQESIDQVTGSGRKYPENPFNGIGELVSPNTDIYVYGRIEKDYFLPPQYNAEYKGESWTYLGDNSADISTAGGNVLSNYYIPVTTNNSEYSNGQGGVLVEHHSDDSDEEILITGIKAYHPKNSVVIYNNRVIDAIIEKWYKDSTSGEIQKQDSLPQAVEDNEEAYLYTEIKSDTKQWYGVEVYFNQKKYKMRDITDEQDPAIWTKGTWVRGINAENKQEYYYKNFYLPVNLDNEKTSLPEQITPVSIYPIYELKIAKVTIQLPENRYVIKSIFVSYHRAEEETTLMGKGYKKQGLTADVFYENVEIPINKFDDNGQYTFEGDEVGEGGVVAYSEFKITGISLTEENHYDIRYQVLESDLEPLKLELKEAESYTLEIPTISSVPTRTITVWKAVGTISTTLKYINAEGKKQSVTVYTQEGDLYKTYTTLQGQKYSWTSVANTSGGYSFTDGGGSEEGTVGTSNIVIKPAPWAWWKMNSTVVSITRTDGPTDSAVFDLCDYCSTLSKFETRITGTLSVPEFDTSLEPKPTTSFPTITKQVVSAIATQDSSSSEPPYYALSMWSYYDGMSVFLSYYSASLWGNGTANKTQLRCLTMQRTTYSTSDKTSAGQMTLKLTAIEQYRPLFEDKNGAREAGTVGYRTITVTKYTGVNSITLNYTGADGTTTLRVTTSGSQTVQAVVGTRYSWTASCNSAYTLNPNSGSGTVESGSDAIVIAPTAELSL